ncbi:hypothetical protein OCGS_0507 [Oceaniovalibus guishaninsula JLT2003]|uniref:Metallo-beta-lactamase domain-containing protein n=1 Tax=Oceaniovalibus guishaninsula JLT2003 TaxID=1231392 RepID=K2HG22_9RHOB|nr:MBL fold metallo-hydrolase [Oceaniovalibus guishaninsula]EKE45417.1 hypothetical protein OCGS_0507 [Oceaniovalibus guishaninsula JLT2003]
MSDDDLKQPVIRKSPSRGGNSPDVWGIYEPDTGSIQYVCADPGSREAALIDVVWDFDPGSYAFSTESCDQVLKVVADNGLSVRWILDTHPHADHVMASALLRQRTGAPNAIGAKVRQIAGIWAGIYNAPTLFDPDRDFDRLLEDGETLLLGALALRVMLSPGHTLGSVSFVCGDAAFTHDTLMQPDSGTSRTDFPGGNAAELWESIQNILTLPDDTRLFVGHDYGTSDRHRPEWEASVADHRANNIHVREGTDRADWIRRRKERDATLPLPDRMLAALQINLRGGRLPDAEADGHRYLKLPVDRF